MTPASDPATTRAGSDPADDRPAADATVSDTTSADTPSADSEPPVGSEPAVPVPEPEPDGIVWPDDGCSIDNVPTPTDVAAGPPPALEVRAESADNQLPDLAVRRINCNGGWVNLKNELPADRPVLVWFWAPH